MAREDSGLEHQTVFICLLLQMISWQFFTLFSPVIFCQLISYDTLLRIQLWVRGLPWGSERNSLLLLPNDLEANWECQGLQHVLHWRNSMALSNALLYKLSSAPWFLQMTKHQPSGLSDLWKVGFPCSFYWPFFKKHDGLWFGLKASVHCWLLMEELWFDGLKNTFSFGS